MTIPPHTSRCFSVGKRKECKSCLRFLQIGNFNTGDTSNLFIPNAQKKCINHIRKPRSDEGRRG